MPNLPELPIEVTGRQVDGDTTQRAVFDTQRGKIPDGHEDKRPQNVHPPTGMMRYREES